MSEEFKEIIVQHVMLLIWTPKTVSHTAKKLYDLFLSVNRTVSTFSITIFDIVVTVAQWFFTKTNVLFHYSENYLLLLKLALFWFKKCTSLLLIYIKIVLIYNMNSKILYT